MPRTYRLSTEELIAGMRLSFTNAYRLRGLLKLKNLGTSDRYSLIPLAIIAFEEIGKMIRIYHAATLTTNSKRAWDGFLKTFTKHPPKHIYAQSLLFGRFVFSLTDLGRYLVTSLRVIGREQYDDAISELINAENENINNLDQLGFTNPYFSGKKRKLNLDNLKLDSLYVDYNQTSGQFEDVIGHNMDNQQLMECILKLIEIRVDTCECLGLSEILDFWENKLINATSDIDKEKLRSSINSFSRKLKTTQQLL